MASKDLLLKPPTPRERAHRRRAIAASLAVHSALLLLALGLAFVYHEKTKPSGSPQVEPTITLSTMVITSPPPTPPVPEKPTPPTPPTPPVPPIPETSVALATPPSVPEIKPAPPEDALPVLPPTPPAAQPTHTVAPKKPAAHPPPPSHPVASTSATHPKQPAVQTTTASSYTPGPSELPHPPYPPEARSAGKTGTVLVNVQFNREGRVTSTEVVQSSGVAILDSSTRSFIRTHWHCQAYAGQTVSVPVQFHLENL